MLSPKLAPEDAENLMARALDVVGRDVDRLAAAAFDRDPGATESPFVSALDEVQLEKTSVVRKCYESGSAPEVRI